MIPGLLTDDCRLLIEKPLGLMIGYWGVDAGNLSKIPFLSGDTRYLSKIPLKLGMKNDRKNSLLL